MTKTIPAAATAATWGSSHARVVGWRTLHDAARREQGPVRMIDGRQAPCTVTLEPETRGQL